ncbi:MAG: hypothetical protein ACYDHU_11505 [Acidimicrobiales bacterium]
MPDVEPTPGSGKIASVDNSSAEASASRSLPTVLESCHSTWIFDTERMRFRRILKGLDLDARQASTAWRPYFGLHLDPRSESFVVLLNPDGSRLLRSWRHVDHCPQCGGEATAELSVDELRGASTS